MTPFSFLCDVTDQHKHGQGVLRSQEKSWKVGENREGQGKSGNFIRVARKKSIIVFSVYSMGVVP